VQRLFFGAVVCRPPYSSIPAFSHFISPKRGQTHTIAATNVYCDVPV
jgi:hypothetical protein